MADGSHPVEETPPKRKASDNPWYRLATLHGQPSDPDDDIAVKNRVTWNRWMAPGVPADLKDTLIAKGWTDEELTPLADDELRDIEASIGLPRPDKIDNFHIDFSHTKFENHFFIQGFLFLHANFRSATFTHGVDFESAIFYGDARFQGATFFGEAAFESATFSGGAYFHSATFTHGVDFESATFSGDAGFGSATFTRAAHFESATFTHDVGFESATFTRAAHFESATFTHDVGFESAIFSGDAHFHRAIFSGSAYFHKATFSLDAYFHSATFTRNASFRSATFTGDVDFINAEMKGLTSFDDVTFTRPPQCFNTKLHEGTTWHRVCWPMPPRDARQAQNFIDAYERLKLEMDKLKKHGDELGFFALEQQCRRVVLGRWKGLPIAVYGFLSDYGRSYARPLLLLGATVIIGAFLFAADSVGFWTPLRLANWKEVFKISFASTFNVVLGRPPVALIDPSELLSVGSKVVSIAQLFIGVVLLFLFGLGIRNRFRMK